MGQGRAGRDETKQDTIETHLERSLASTRACCIICMYAEWDDYDESETCTRNDC